MLVVDAAFAVEMCVVRSVSLRYFLSGTRREEIVGLLLGGPSLSVVLSWVYCMFRYWANKINL